MKAHACGTMSEQSRFRRGYRQPREISRDDVRRCRNCGRARAKDSGALQCSLDGYAVAPGGKCQHWAEVGSEDLPLIGAALGAGVE